MPEQLHVLCVDDEPRVLEGLMLNLRRYYRVRPRPVARVDWQSLTETIRRRGRLGHAHARDGRRSFLSQVKQRSPDTVRSCPGQADLDSAIAAVNHGQVFSIPHQAVQPQTLSFGHSGRGDQHRLITAERELWKKPARKHQGAH